VLSPDYIRLRQILVETLRPYPEVAAKVSAALHEIETDGAKAIADSTRTSRWPVRQSQLRERCNRVPADIAQRRCSA
jgi:hypothetical protein